MAAFIALLVTAAGFGIVAAAALGLYVVLALWLELNVSYVGCSGLTALLIAALAYETYKYVTEEAPTDDEN
jgi:hypothetical protein